MSTKKYTSSELREIAKYHKLVCYCILIVLVLVILVLIIGVIVPVTGTGNRPLFGLMIGMSNNPLLGLIRFMLIGFEIFSLYKLARALKFSIVLIILLGLCLFVPILSLIVLLFMNGQAIKPLKEAGIKVGLLGADMNSIDIS